MWIKQQGFKLPLPPKLGSLFAMNGQEIYLVDQFRSQFKQAWIKQKNSGEPADYQRIDVTQSQDWQQLDAAFGNYSLFSSLTIVDVFFDKKSLDKEAKSILTEYLKRADPACLLLLHLPQLTSTALKFLADSPHAILTSVKTPDKTTVERWIADQLRAHYNTFSTVLPALIYQYTQGNLLACSQVLQKIALTEERTEYLSEGVVLAHLENQCNYTLYELSDSCLAGDAAKALLILRQALENRQELTLVLWIITQEIRLLIQLNESQRSNIPWQAALTQLKIWPSRGGFYQSALKRVNPTILITLLTWCSKLDLMIKTSQSTQIDATLERMVISLCLGKEII